MTNEQLAVFLEMAQLAWNRSRDRLEAKLLSYGLTDEQLRDAIWYMPNYYDEIKILRGEKP